MTNTLTVSNVVNREGIEAHRAGWLADVQAIQLRHQELTAKYNQETRELQLQESALNGAIQACDILIKQIDSGSTPVPINLVPTTQSE